MPGHVSKGHEKISLGGPKPAAPACIPLGGKVGKPAAVPEAPAEIPRIELEARHAITVMADPKLRRQVLESHLKHEHQPVATITISPIPASKGNVYQLTHITRGLFGRKKTKSIIIDSTGKQIA